MEKWRPLVCCNFGNDEVREWALAVSTCRTHRLCDSFFNLYKNELRRHWIPEALSNGKMTRGFI